MAIARSTGAFIGTSEGSLQAVAAAATQTGAQVDVLGDDTSAGEIELYVVITAGATVAATSGLDVQINNVRVTGQVYENADDVFQRNVTTPAATTTKKYSLGRYPASRYMSANCTNLDATNAISVFVGYELFKFS